jgi:hypothetical protein
MKAIEFDRYGEPAEVLAVHERALPEPGKGQVRVTEIVLLMREGILATSSEAHSFPLDDIGTAVKQAESAGRHGKVLIVPEG